MWGPGQFSLVSRSDACDYKGGDGRKRALTVNSDVGRSPASLWVWGSIAQGAEGGGVALCWGDTSGSSRGADCEGTDSTVEGPPLELAGSYETAPK